MNCTLEEGMQFSRDQKWRLMVFDEFLEREYGRCAVHGDTYTFSLYQPFLDQGRFGKGDYVLTPIGLPVVTVTLHDG